MSILDALEMLNLARKKLFINNIQVDKISVCSLQIQDRIVQVNMTLDQHLINCLSAYSAENTILIVIVLASAFYYRLLLLHRPIKQRL